MLRILMSTKWVGARKFNRSLCTSSVPKALFSALISCVKIKINFKSLEAIKVVAYLFKKNIQRSADGSCSLIFQKKYSRSVVVCIQTVIDKSKSRDFWFLLYEISTLISFNVNIRVRKCA